MSAGSKSCPTCLEEWAGTFKFCPEDGTLLVAQVGSSTLVTPAAPAAKAPTQEKRRASKAVDVSKPRTNRSQRAVTEAAPRPVPAQAAERPAPDPCARPGPRGSFRGSVRVTSAGSKEAA